MKINGFINGSVTFKQYQILGGFSSFSSWGHFVKKWQPDFGEKNLFRQLGKRDKFGLKTEYFGILKGLTLFCYNNDSDLACLGIPNVLWNNKAPISLGRVKLLCLFVACIYIIMEATDLSYSFRWVWSGIPKAQPK